MIKRKSKHEFRISVGDTSLVPYTANDLHNLKDWCKQQFGEPGKKARWRYGWVYRDTDTFYFRDEKDALFFALRWS